MVLSLRTIFMCIYTMCTHTLCFDVSGQILQVVRAPNGAQYIIQPQQQILLQQQMQPGGVQAPVIQQVRTVTQRGRAAYDRRKCV